MASSTRRSARYRLRYGLHDDALWTSADGAQAARDASRAPIESRASEAAPQHSVLRSYLN